MKRVEVVLDNVSAAFDNIATLIGKQVLIGIPETNAGRQGETINNATLGYIHEFGSPAANIPARPFLIPGVEKAREPALRQLRKAVKAALDGDHKKSDQALNGAGIIGANEVRGEINNGNFVPLKPSTVAGRARSRGAKTRRENEQVYLDLISKGVNPGAAQTETDIRPLINTGQLRNSITYVIVKK